MGYPTANLRVDSSSIKPGVYGCEAIYLEHKYPAMCYVADDRPGILEVHLFEYEGDLYGHLLKVSLGTYIREPVKVSDWDTLKQRIKHDAEACLRPA